MCKFVSCEKCRKRIAPIKGAFERFFRVMICPNCGYEWKILKTEAGAQ